MATTHPVRRSQNGVTTQATSDTTGAAATTEYPTAVKYFAGGIRLALGWTFLWAFLDKLFGLGHETAKADSWLNGGSPTQGFLAFAAKGPFKGFYNDIAGATWADWLFMIGLAAIGTALILGVFVNIAAISGSVLLVMMWSVVLPPENNLFMDDHLIYAGVLGLLALMGAGRFLGLGSMWERMPFVQKMKIFR